jgi:DNA (cytosine-5)-methyltransferase 1
MRAISLFSGAGGLDIGCEIAGFETFAAVELNARARETLLANAPRYFPALEPDAVFEDAVRLETSELLARLDLEPGDIDLVHGGPPCTPFSKSGNWLDYKLAGADPKASLLDSFVAVVGAAQPKAFLMENVYGLAYRNHNRAVFDRFLASAAACGYEVRHKIVVAADYGVPQLRQRLVCVGIRRDVLASDPETWEMSWPAPTHAGPHETRKDWDRDLPPHLGAGGALRDLNINPDEPEEIVEGTYAEALRGVPPGENYLHWTKERGHPEPRFRWRSRYWNFLLKLHPDRPSPTIQGQPGPWVGPFHWDNRRLRVAEVKRLMTFPDAFIVLGNRREQQLQLGNAVPPMLAARVAGAISSVLADAHAVESPALARAA